MVVICFSSQLLLFVWFWFLFWGEGGRGRVQVAEVDKKYLLFLSGMMIGSKSNRLHPKDHQGCFMQLPQKSPKHNSLVFH